MNTTTARRRLALGAALSAAVLAGAAMPAVAAPAPPAAGFTVKAFHGTGTESKPDDIVRLGNSIYVAYQNGIGPLGEPAADGTTASTVQQFSLEGTPGASWNIPGRIDGMGADEAGHRLLLTTNEDGNSSFHTLTPARGSQAVKDYAYMGLTHGGGTDAVTVYHGRILVSGSNPSDSTGPAVYEATLTGSTAALAPVVRDNATATLANGPHAGQATTLALTDPDSNTKVPAASPRFKDDFMLDAQGDQQLIFARHTDTPHQALQVLDLPQPVDDTAFAAHRDQTLWATDPDHNTVDAITGPFTDGQALSAVTPDSGPDYLAALNLDDGSLTPIPALAAVHPKGMLFTDPS
jgi:hypothetical protein